MTILYNNSLALSNSRASFDMLSLHFFSCEEGIDIIHWNLNLFYGSKVNDQIVKVYIEKDIIKREKYSRAERLPSYDQY